MRVPNSGDHFISLDDLKNLFSKLKWGDREASYHLGVSRRVILKYLKGDNRIPQNISIMTRVFYSLFVKSKDLRGFKKDVYNILEEENLNRNNY